MKNFKLEYFFKITSNKDNPSTNLKLIKNNIANKSTFKYIKDFSIENNNQKIKKMQRPLSTTIYSKEIRNNNTKNINELLKQNIYNNSKSNNSKNNLYSVNMNHILEEFYINKSSKRNNYKEINGNNFEDLILKKIISLPKIYDTNRYTSSMNSITIINSNQINKNITNQKKNNSNLPFFNSDNGNKTQLYNNENNLNIIKSRIPLNDQEAKILKLLTSKNNSNESERKKIMIKNETFQQNNPSINNFNYINDNKLYNNTMNSILLKTSSNKKLSNTNINNNSLIYSSHHGPNTSLENKNQNRYINFKLIKYKEIESINSENKNIIKTNDNLNFINLYKNNNMNDNQNLRTSYDSRQKQKLKFDKNNNYFLKEEFLEKINNIRKIYKERDAKRQNLKCFYYLVLPGNASYLVEKCMLHRINWVKPFSVVTNLYNFKWQELSYGIDYGSLGYYPNVNQIVNHYENHFVISNKARMFTNLMNYCEKRKISVFKYVPFTIVFNLRDDKNKDKEENEKNNNNDKINKNEKDNNNNDKYEKLKEFINNIQKYLMKYNDLGSYYFKDNYKSYKKLLKEKEKEEINKNIYNRDFNKYLFKKKYKLLRKVNRRSQITTAPEQKKENDSEIENEKKYGDFNYIFYSNFFNNLIEDNNIPIYDKNKERKYEQENNLNTLHKQGEKNTIDKNIIGTNTIIEIPESHFSGHNMWIVKAINLNRGMCIRIVNSYEQMVKIIEKFKQGVDYNFTKENIEENNSKPQTKNNKINISPSKSPSKIKSKFFEQKEKIIKKNITNNLNSYDKIKNKINILNSSNKINESNNLNSPEKTKNINNNNLLIIENLKNITNNSNLSEKANNINYNISLIEKPKNIHNNKYENNNIKIKIEEEKKNNNEKEEKLYNCSKIIIQKYIENPLLYYGRKCDIRIWVLLTQSMKVYVFKEGHLKTCSIEYNLSSKDAFAHITNYSFQKYNSNFQKYEKGNEVPFYEFQKFLDEKYSEKKYNIKTDLLGQIKEIVKITMKSVKEKINQNNRNYQFEIFGYDFMMDKDFNLFLIEINTNPGLEESSPWIKLIIPRMLDDALRLTIDQLFETKYDFSIIDNYKTNEEIINYKKILNNYNKHLDINGINESSSLNIPINKLDNKNNKEEFKDSKINEYNSNTIYNPIITDVITENEKEEENEKNNNEKQDENTSNTENKDINKNKNKKYISPFPVPGYTLNENIWDFVCDLNEIDPLDDLIEKEEEEEIKENNIYISYKSNFKKRKNKKGKKRKIKLKKNLKNSKFEKEETSKK